MREEEDSILPSGMHAGSPEEALDCAAGLYLAAYEGRFNGHRSHHARYQTPPDAGPAEVIPIRRLL